MRIRYILWASAEHGEKTPLLDEKVKVVRKLLESNLKGDAFRRRLLGSVVLAFRVNFQNMTADKDILAGMKKEIQEVFDKERKARNIDAEDIWCKKALSNNLYAQLAENIGNDIKDKQINTKQYKRYFHTSIHRAMDEIITQYKKENPAYINDVDEAVIGRN